MSRRSIDVPEKTLEWLSNTENPAVAYLTSRELLGDEETPGLADMWGRRNEYAPVAAILEAQLADGSWDKPSQDYRKYSGSLWQVHLLGELMADGDDERVGRGADYAFSRQLPDGSWSATNMRPAGSITCLTANVGRALARMGYASDERIVGALRHCVDTSREMGAINCRSGAGYQLNGYCHMLVPKLLLFLAEVPREAWPAGADRLRDECVARLREKTVFHCLPEESREFNDILWSAPSNQRDGLRERFLAEHPELHYKAKPGWLRFGYPLSYNSDVLEAMWALAAIGEPVRPEYSAALDAVRDAADAQMRWTMRNSLNGKMLADVEVKGQPSRWLTLRALRVLQHFGGDAV